MRLNKLTKIYYVEIKMNINCKNQEASKEQCIWIVKKSSKSTLEFGQVNQKYN